MENGPETPKKPYEQPGWQDITIGMIHELIAEDKLEQARFSAVIRKKALEQACLDIDDAVEKRQGEITVEKWLAEKVLIEQEIAELQNIIRSIDTDTQNE